MDGIIEFDIDGDGDNVDATLLLILARRGRYHSAMSCYRSREVPIVNNIRWLLNHDHHS